MHFCSDELAVITAGVPFLGVTFAYVRSLLRRLRGRFLRKVQVE